MRDYIQKQVKVDQKTKRTFCYNIISAKIQTFSAKNIVYHCEKCVCPGLQPCFQPLTRVQVLHQTVVVRNDEENYIFSPTFLIVSSSSTTHGLFEP